MSWLNKKVKGLALDLEGFVPSEYQGFVDSTSEDEAMANKKANKAMGTINREEQAPADREWTAGDPDHENSPTSSLPKREHPSSRQIPTTTSHHGATDGVAAELADTSTMTS